MKHHPTHSTVIFILLTSIILPTLIAASDQTNKKELATFMVFAKRKPTQATINKIKPVATLKLAQLATQKKPAQTDTVPPATAPAKVTVEQAKTLIKEIAKELATPGAAISSLLTQAAKYAEIIRDSYSRFNPYRYTLSNRISALKGLSKQTPESNTAEAAKNYQNKAISELKKITDRLK